jgi:hypothetical protein
MELKYGTLSRTAEAHPASYPVGTRDPFPEGKAQPRRNTDNSPPPSADVKNEELYLSPPLCPHGMYVTAFLKWYFGEWSLQMR